MKTITTILLITIALSCQAQNATNYPVHITKSGEFATNYFTATVNSVWVTNNSWKTITIQATNIVIKSNQCYVMLEGYGIVAASPDFTTNAINSLITSGEFCRVRGHQWRYYAHDTVRICPNCNEMKNKRITTTEEWK